MPLINGMKMACEPCIRGHRSTKCTHANERLMVPVRKPGRPLSQCPHPRDQPCGCGSVTAAIPRKQTCGCGNNAVDSTSSSPQILPQSLPQPPTNGTPIEAPSPTRTTFKIQKSRPQSGRKQSFDPTSFERMDMNSVNILPYEHRPQVSQLTMPNGYPMAGFAQLYGYMPQYPTTMQAHAGHYQMPPPPLPFGPDGIISLPGHLNGYSNGTTHTMLEHKVETPVISKPELPQPDKANSVISPCCQPKPVPEVKQVPVTTNGGSCCGPKTNGHSHSASSSSSSNTIPEEPEPVQASCCAPKVQQVPKSEPISTNGTPIMQPQMLQQNGIPFNPALYQHYTPQPTLFTYPSTYGSFQNPLQPEAWRESMRASNYGQPQSTIPPPGPLPYDTPLLQNTMDTVHSCHCGDSCACIGCAAHPYNDQTRAYIRSAWESMNLEPTNETYANGHHPENGISMVTPAVDDFITSPTANTPSSTTSGNGEEQSLPAGDFFFVSYPFTGDGCGGDTQSCPCGDDCQCLGCTIHNQDLVSLDAGT